MPDSIKFLQPGQCIALYMGVSATAEIAASLQVHRQADEIAITIVVKAQTPDEVVLECTPKTLVETVHTHEIRDTAIIMVRLSKAAEAAKKTVPVPLELVG